MNEMINNIMQYFATACIVLGVLAFVTSVIVQVIKEMPHLKNVQTGLIALIVAELLTVLALFAGCSYMDMVILWYYIAAAVIAGFFVYMIATGGWDKLKEIWDRTKYDNNRR